MNDEMALADYHNRIIAIVDYFHTLEHNLPALEMARVLNDIADMLIDEAIETLAEFDPTEELPDTGDFDPDDVEEYDPDDYEEEEE